MVMTMADSSTKTSRELKKGTSDLLVLTLLAERDRHGYELAKLIEQRSNGELVFHVASLYTLLYRLEDRGLVAGRWVERAGERRRRFYRLSALGKKVVASQRREWRRFVLAVDRVMAPESA